MEAATMKAGGKTIPPDHSLPQTPHCKAVREREQEGMVYRWNTTGGRSHATPRSWEAAAAGGSPLLLFLLTASFLYINEEILQLQREILPTPKQPPEHTGNELFLSNTVALFHS